MSRYDRTPFNPVGKYVARRGFTFNGKTYATGQKFDYGHIACSLRKLKHLYDSGFLLLDDDKKYDAPKAAKKPAKKKKAKKIAEETEVEYKPVETNDDIESFLSDQD